jgi:hypothetical protein
MFSGEVLDISLKGILIGLSGGQAAPELGRDVAVRVPLGEDPEMAIRMTARVQRSETGHIGCAWVDIDLDSLTRLRRLLELNTAQPEALERELGQLLHGSPRD